MRKDAVALAAVALAAGCGGAQTYVVRAGPNVDASDYGGWQAEVSIAADPRRQRTLFAASNSGNRAGTRAYTSVDGGRTWTTSMPRVPLEHRSACGRGDPAVAIDGKGRESLAFIVHVPCDLKRRRPTRATIAVVQRARANAPWVEAGTVAPGFEDKPALAVDERPGQGNRLYVTWTNYTFGELAQAMFAASSDGGRHWSEPFRLGYSGGNTETAVATAPDGAVDVVWSSSLSGTFTLARSRDGLRFSAIDRRTFGQFRQPGSDLCRPGVVETSIPAQRIRCVGQDPHLAVDLSRSSFRGRAYVVYEAGTARGVQDIYIAAFTPGLRAVRGFPHRVNPPDGRVASDQFLPALAIDRSSGAVWVCFYDTTGDPSRRKAWFSCTESANGGRTFLKPAHAANVPSDETRKPADTRFGYGEYAGVAAAAGLAYPVWTDSRRLRTLEEEIFTTRMKVR